MPKKTMEPADLFLELAEETPISLSSLSPEDLEEIKACAAYVKESADRETISGLVALETPIALHGGSGNFVRLPDRVIAASAGTVLRGILVGFDFLKGKTRIKPDDDEDFEEFEAPVHYLIGYFALVDAFGTSELELRPGAVVPVLFRDKISGHPGALSKFMMVLSSLKCSVNNPLETAAFIWSLQSVKCAATTKKGKQVNWHEIEPSVSNGASELSQDPCKKSVFHHSLLPLMRFSNHQGHGFKPGISGVLDRTDWQDSYEAVGELLQRGQTLVTPGNDFLKLSASQEPLEPKMKELTEAEIKEAAKQAKNDIGL